MLMEKLGPSCAQVRYSGIFPKSVWITLLFLYGCTTVPVQSISKFKEGLSAVQTDSRAILLEHNRFVRDLHLDWTTSLSLKLQRGWPPPH